MIFSSQRFFKTKVDQIHENVQDQFDQFKDQDEGDAKKQRKGSSKGIEKICTIHLWQTDTLLERTSGSSCYDKLSNLTTDRDLDSWDWVLSKSVLTKDYVVRVGGGGWV